MKGRHAGSSDEHSLTWIIVVLALLLALEVIWVLVFTIFAVWLRGL